MELGIAVEYNPDLALRNISEYESGSRQKEECIPENLEPGQVHDFLKKELRNYYLEGEVPLCQTDGKGNLSRPLASIQILEATHFLRDGKHYTRGKFKVIEVFSKKDDKVQFEGFFRTD